MNKETFLKQLEESLDIFNEDIKKEEINNILAQINEKEQAGKKEKEIIEELSISKIQKDIYIKRGLNPKKITKNKTFIYKEFEELFQVIHHVIDEMSKNDFQSNMKIIFDIVILLAFICIVKIPFILIRNLGDSLILYLEIPILSNIWGLIIDIIYIIVAVVIFMNIFTKYFKNMKSTKKKTIKTKELEAVNLEEKSEK